MTARLSQLTMISEDHFALARFYEGFFHMRPGGGQGPMDDVSIGDGHIGIAIKPRVAGHLAQLDYFAIAVDDLDGTLARIREHHPTIGTLANFAGAPAGAVATYDPDGNLFVLTRPKCDGIASDGPNTRRRIDHVALRVLHPGRVAEFYRMVFGWTEIEGPRSIQRNTYLSDGHATLVLIPWTLNDFEGTGISARGLDHIGFRVESIASLKTEIDTAAVRNPRVHPSTSILGKGKEGSVRLDMFRRTCPLGEHHLADPDGLLLDVIERPVS